MILTLTVPQAWMKYRAKNWTPPEFWDVGVTGFIMDYNLYASQYVPSHGDSNQNVNTYGTLGFNLGAWRLRSDYQYDQSFTENNSNGSNSSLPRTYLFRPIPSWRRNSPWGSMISVPISTIRSILPALHWRATNRCYRRTCADTRRK